MGQTELLIMHAIMQMCIVAGDNPRASQRHCKMTTVGSSHINQTKLYFDIQKFIAWRKLNSVPDAKFTFLQLWKWSLLFLKHFQ